MPLPALPSGQALCPLEPMVSRGRSSAIGPGAVNSRSAKSMRTNLRIFSLIASAGLIGCGPGSGPGSKLLPDKHHGGVLVPLTDNQVYVELLNGERKKTGSTYDTTVIAYLLESDL